MEQDNTQTELSPDNSDGFRGTVCKLCAKGTLWEKCDSYISYCESVEVGETKSAKRRTRLPNLAGLCRYLGTGLDDLRMLKEDYPESYDRLLAVFEDEALNYDASATLLSSYMKKRLLFQSDTDADGKAPMSPGISYCFEHNIFDDGE